MLTKMFVKNLISSRSAVSFKSCLDSCFPNCSASSINTKAMSISSSAQSNSRQVTDYEHFTNSKSKRRKPSALEITKRFAMMPPHTISFAVGVPNVKTFPFEQVSLKLKDGSSFELQGKDLEAALQYTPSSGYPKFVKELQDLQDRIHGAQDWSRTSLIVSCGYPKLVKQLQDLQDRTHGAQDWSRTSLLMSCGSSEAMSAVLDMILVEGDAIILPVPVYTGAIDSISMFLPEFLVLEQDRDGPDPSQLRKLLQERKLQNKSLPKLMYVNPTGCNPTGVNISTERKKEFYNIACEFNFLILEDDPYHALHFMEGDVPSFLSMDTEGRVLRLDSFSKILSSGLRLGYLTGPSSLVRQVELSFQTSTLHTSALSQVIVSKLLEYWGEDKYNDHVRQVKRFYRERRDLMMDACKRHLKGLAEWETPAGGMFLWMKIPGLKDTHDLATKRCLDKFLLIIPGHPFAGQLVPQQYNYIRISYSLATPDQMEQGINILADIIKEIVEFSDAPK